MKKRAFVISAVLLILFVVLTNSCMQFRKSDAEVRDHFTESNVPVKIVYSQIEDRKIRYIKSGNNTDKLVVFIHGAPGSSQDYYHLLEDSTLLENCSMISVDRPGYGYSEFGRSEKSIKRQSFILTELIRKANSDYNKIVILGHSFGGPVAGIMGVANDSLIDKIILLAPAIDPEFEIVFWISYLVKWPPFRWFTPTAWRVASDEKFSHVKALRDIKNLWARIDTDLIHVHGTKDILVPYENVYFSSRNIPSEFLEIQTLEGANHFLPWSHTELVKELILNSLKED